MNTKGQAASSRLASSSDSVPMDPLGKTVATELTINRFKQTSTGIAGTATNIQNSFKELQADLKSDLAGLKEYKGLQQKLDMRKAELQKRIADNNAWIANFENDANEQGAFEAQYKKLLEDIQLIYNDAKEFHGKGIDMLIQQFRYHLAFKRWNDTFTAVPFKPK